MKYLTFNAKFLAWGLSVAGVAGLFFLAWKYFVPRVRRPAQHEEEAGPKVTSPSSSTVLTLPHAPQADARPMAVVEGLQLAKQLQENDLRELVQERLADIADEREDLERWALAIVDLLDELRLMQPSYSPQDSKAAALLRDELLRLLREQDCELIDLDDWTPSRQRALRVEHKLPEGEAPRILSKETSGLIVKGSLVRKQEVSVKLSTNN